MYRVVVQKKAEKELKRIDRRCRRRILAAIAFLREEPLRGKKIEGKYKHRYGIRVWPYRIVYEVDKRRRVVLVVRVGYRQGVYK